jgi:hypothetical protein
MVVSGWTATVDGDIPLIQHQKFAAVVDVTSHHWRCWQPSGGSNMGEATLPDLRYGLYTHYYLVLWLVVDPWKDCNGPNGRT